MAYSLIKGENVVLEFYMGGVWKPYACARSCTLSIATELKETTVTGAGKFKHFTPTVNSFSVAFDGISSLNDAAVLNIYDLRELQLNHVLCKARFYRTADNGSSYYVSEVDFYITNSEDTNPFDNISTFTLQGQGVGVPGQTLINPPTTTTTVRRYEYTGTGGEAQFTASLLINKSILAVHKDGIGFSKLITSGTPASKEAKYTAASGRIDFPIAFEPGEEAYVLYQDL